MMIWPYLIMFPGQNIVDMKQYDVIIVIIITTTAIISKNTYYELSSLYIYIYIVGSNTYQPSLDPPKKKHAPPTKPSTKPQHFWQTSGTDDVSLTCHWLPGFTMPWRSTFDAVPDFTPLHLATALWARAGEDSLKQHEAREDLMIGNLPGAFPQ